MPSQQARYWLLTINDADDGTSWIRPTELNPKQQWLKGQKEIGSGTNRPHWQVIYYSINTYI